VFTGISTSFNLFAMRHGILIVGADRRTLRHDLLSMPRLLVLFAANTARSCARLLT
jgi:hypothetical protein